MASGHLTAGTVAGPLTLAGLLGQGVIDLTRAFEYWKPAKISYERIAAIVDTDRRPRKRSAKPKTDVGLTIDGLHTGAGLKVGRVVAAPGDVVIVDGSNSAGKSALLAAIAMPSQVRGTVEIDGTNLDRIPERRRAKLVGYARSGLPLLPGSLGHNLDYRRTGALADEMVDVARLCGLGSLIDRLPGGLGGRIKDASELSSSERAGIALARAMIGSPALLLLDSIDAELDATVLGAVAKNLAERRGITVIVAQKPEWRNISKRRWLIANNKFDDLGVASAETVIPIERGTR